MCGVIGLIYEREHPEMGRVAAELLKTLEYRGYDSTGAAIQGLEGPVKLVKGVGAPSLLVRQLGITEMTGQVFCGQVRWATFGAVTDKNSQPHSVACKTAIYGAHNGNLTNSDELQAWLLAEGHQVLSDNDGEMLVHTVEQMFARELAARPGAGAGGRRECMRAALAAAASRIQGAYAAVVVDPQSRVVWALKQGSSLYFGLGSDERGGPFGIASSDLSSILRLTRVVVPLSEGELVEFDPAGYQVYGIVPAPDPAKGLRLEPRERAPRRSRLQAKDTALLPPFTTFMEQEISAQQDTCRELATIYTGGSEAVRTLAGHLDALGESDLEQISAGLDALRDAVDDPQIRQRFHAIADLPGLRALLSGMPEELRRQGTDAPTDQLAGRLVSAEAGLLADLLPMARGQDDLLAVRLLDALLERDEVREYADAVERFGEMCCETVRRGGRIYVTCCGSSHNAALAGALFFNELARIELVPLLPGEFRGQVARCLKDGDLFLAVSQSGETKDLVDVMNDVIASGLEIGRVSLVNNVNSTLAQEKTQLCIPLRCGPEVAVPATKSFLSQVMAFYLLALHMGQRRLDRLPLPEEQRRQLQRELARRRETLHNIPELIRLTVERTAGQVEQAASMLYLVPSAHLLATRLTAVAKEGALKIREVVLNHTEGVEGSEFKHGPNTILGFNTLLGPDDADTLLTGVGRALARMVAPALERGADAAGLQRLIQAVADSVFSPASAFLSLTPAERLLVERSLDHGLLEQSLSGDYPLIYVTGSDERDVALTVSQINTHKIRGASTVVIAEEHPALRQAAAKAPADNPAYRWVYIPLPRTGDPLMATFSATVVLQRLALKMSLLKARYLDRLGIKDHGVHPDVPKNVSKSITVD
jgi:glucosamine 6-phosphate synthetase-like amidotransferase/phosphosugar isomerase protein